MCDVWSCVLCFVSVPVRSLKDIIGNHSVTWSVSAKKLSWSWFLSTQKCAFFFGCLLQQKTATANIEESRCKWMGTAVFLPQHRIQYKCSLKLSFSLARWSTKASNYLSYSLCTNFWSFLVKFWKKSCGDIWLCLATRIQLIKNQEMMLTMILGFTRQMCSCVSQFFFSASLTLWQKALNCCYIINK